MGSTETKNSKSNRIEQGVYPSLLPNLGNESMVAFNSVDVIREIPTQATSNLPESLQEKPYLKAEILVTTITPDYPVPIYFSSKYVLADTQKFLENEDPTKMRRGFSKARTMFAIVDSSDGHVSGLIPPIIFEEWEDDQGNPYLLVADGNNRLYHRFSNHPDKSFEVIIVKNIPDRYRPVYDPVNYSEVKVLPKAPPLKERRMFSRNFNPATYQDNRPDFSLFGSQGPRSSLAERIVNSSHRRLIEIADESQINKVLMEKIRQGFEGYAPPPPDTITAPKLEQRLPQIVDFERVVPICDTLGAAVFDIKYSPETQGKFKAITVTAEEFARHSVRGVTLLPPEADIKFHAPKTLPGEFRITPDVLTGLNNSIADSNISLPELKLASSSNPFAQEVSGFRIWKENSRFYSVVVLELENGLEVPIVLNRYEKDEQGNDVSGSIFVIDDGAHNRFLTFHFREMIGLNQLETPRMFGFDLARLVNNVGKKIAGGIDIYRKIEIQNYGLDNSPVTFYLCGTLLPYWEHVAQPVFGLYKQTVEIDTLGKLSSRTIHNHIVSGAISDSITIASLTLSQMVGQELFLSKKYKDHHIVMEKIFDPFLGPRLTLPRLPISLQDPTTYQFTDLGKSINVQYPRSLDWETFNQNISQEACLTSVPLRDLQEMIIGGRIDHTSIAHLSTLLRRQNVWVFSPQQKYPF